MINCIMDLRNSLRIVPLSRDRKPLRARFLEDAEPVVIVIDYNVIARSLFGSSFATWSILDAIRVDHNDGERLLGHLLSPYISFFHGIVF